MTFEFLIASETDMTAGSTGCHESVRVIIYLDRQCNGAAATALDILASDQYNSFRNLGNVKRFKILYDKLRTYNTGAYAAGNGTANDSHNVVHTYNQRVNLKVFIPIEFDGTTTGALSTIKSNNIGILLWSKHGGRMKMETSLMRTRFMDY